MRWKRPNEGSMRRIKAFLWWPRMINGETRWLEWATIDQRYDSGPYGSGWSDWEWVDLP